MDGAPGQRALMALVSAETSRLLRTSDDIAITRHILSVPTHGLIVSSTFPSTTAAICWLTDPTPADVVQSVTESGLFLRSSSTASVGRWLAVVSRGASSCFDVEHTGTKAILTLMKSSVSPVCAVGRFLSAADAYCWMGSPATAAWLQILVDSVGVDASARLPPQPALPWSRKAPLGNRTQPDQVVSAASQWPARGGSVGGGGQRSMTLAGGARPARNSGLGGPHDGEASVLLPAELPARPDDGSLDTIGFGVARSSFAFWSARAAAMSAADAGEPSPARYSSAVAGTPLPATGSFFVAGSSPQKRRVSTLSAVPLRSTTVQVSPCGSRPARDRADAPSHPPSPITARHSVPGCVCSSPRGKHRCTCDDAGSKKMRLVEQGGVPASLNPAGIARDERTSSMFSRANISRWMAEGLCAWKQHDADRALALSMAKSLDSDPSASRDVDKTVQFQEAECRGTDAAGELTSWCASSASLKPACTSTVLLQSPMAGADEMGPSLLVADIPQPASPFGRPDCLEVEAASDALGVAKCVHGQAASSPLPGRLGQLAATEQWRQLYDELVARDRGAFVTGGPGVGKSTVLRGFTKALRVRWPRPGEVVVVAPTGSAAKTAEGQTYHSFFGFPRGYDVQLEDPAIEAARLLKRKKYRVISRRLATVRVLLLDEVSMVSAATFDVMCELLRQSRPETTPPCQVYTFGDFLQLGPKGGGCLAFTSRSWRQLYGNCMLELTVVHRQLDTAFVRAIRDARLGLCSPAVEQLMEDCSVTEEQYKRLKCSVLHLMPRHEDVERHNYDCLMELCNGRQPGVFEAVDTIELDKDRETGSRFEHDVPPPDLARVSEHSRNAALFDCVAPRRVQHCVGARVMLTSNLYPAVGLYHGSIGRLSSYKNERTPIVRFDHHKLPSSMRRGTQGVHDAGADWVEVECPPVAFEARIMANPGVVAVRRQVPLALGWGITIHRSQSLSLTEAVLDIGEAFGPGMVNAAISRVSVKSRMHVKSFAVSRLFADPIALKYYEEGSRL